MSWSQSLNPPRRGATRLGGALYSGISGSEPGVRLDQGRNVPVNPETARLLENRRKAAQKAGAVEVLGQKLARESVRGTVTQPGGGLSQSAPASGLGDKRSNRTAPATLNHRKANGRDGPTDGITSAAPPPPSHGQTVEGTLRGLMQDPRYWQPGRVEDAYRDGITRLFQAAWPDPAEMDETGRPRKTSPVIDVETLEVLSRRLLPHPENQETAGAPTGELPAGRRGRETGGNTRAFHGETRRYPLHLNTREEHALYDVFTGRPPVQDATPSQSLSTGVETGGPSSPLLVRVADTVEAPGMGHNSNAMGDVDKDADQEEASPYLRREGESFEEFDWRIRKGLEARDLTEAELLAMQEAYLAALDAEDPDWRLHAQGVTRESLEGMVEVTDPGQVEAALRLWMENGGMLPPGTGASLAYVVDPEGRVFHIDPSKLDASLLGPTGVLSELNNRAFAARGREVVEHGDFSDLLEFGLEAGAFTFAGFRQFATITRAPAGGRTGGGSGGASGRPSGQSMPDDFPRNTRVENPLTPREFENLPAQGMIDPARIRTIQDTVTYRFSDGRTLAETRQSFTDGNAPDIPPIRIFERDGKIWTLDHRRLVAARLAGVELRYVKASPEDVMLGIRTKTSTVDDGMTVEIIEKRKKK